MTKSDDGQAERQRILEGRDDTAAWRRWGPYLSERSWGTVREDYSENGTAWDYFPHDHARSRTYRWNEDGLAGLCDDHGVMCFGLALWNEADPILKERMFGLTGAQGNHGEDVKEYYYYLDSTPTHSHMRYLYKYPQRAFPYGDLVAENGRRGRSRDEYELVDTGVFEGDKYFDVFVEYAKADTDDILIEISAYNRGPEPAALHLLPTVWYRNFWSWDPECERPRISALDEDEHGHVGVSLSDVGFGPRWLVAEGSPEVLFTENESNYQRLWGVANHSPYVKDAFHSFVIHGNPDAVNPEKVGTKAAFHYRHEIEPGECVHMRLRLTDRAPSNWLEDFEEVVEQRRAEADAFYESITPESVDEDTAQVMRQAIGGLLWSKQHYHYDVERWLDGDPGQPAPPAQRKQGRNKRWTHLHNDDVISMPDKWEYPWYAAWDLAFHCVSLALVDPEFAKEQVLLLLKERYMHPNGQLPAYEWAFGDANPPVQAWAALQIYEMERRQTGEGDVAFLEQVFHKLLLNFTSWVNRKDVEGDNLFEGGFLGLDNIGVFDRSSALPTGGHIEQSDGTGWMAMYSLNMLHMALELAQTNPVYEDLASKFWEHFIFIDHAMNARGENDISMWDDKDGFYYDVLRLNRDDHFPMRIRSIVGLIPLFATTTFDADMIEPHEHFARRRRGLLENRPELAQDVATMRRPGHKGRMLMALVNPDRLKRILEVMLDESEFLSDYGIRSVSRRHKDAPYRLEVDGEIHQVSYQPAESRIGLFGGNSNWRGPIWFPINYLLVQSLMRYHEYLGDDFTVECPTGSGQQMTLAEVAGELAGRLTRIFKRGEDGRAVFGEQDRFQNDPHFRDYVLFHEYFHGDTGKGLGASHQTGWTALVANLIAEFG